MQREYKFEAILVTIGLIVLHHHSCAAIPAEQRVTRQAKETNSEMNSQAGVKILSGLATNQPQTLSSFGGVPYGGGRYGGLAYGGSGYPGSPAMRLLGMQFGGAVGPLPGFNTLQLASPGNLDYPAMGNYVGNNLPPYPLIGPDVYANYLLNGLPQSVQNLDNFVNMPNMQGITGSRSQTPLLGPKSQPMQLQGLATQLQPQIAAGYPFANYGQLNGYGPAFQGYQLL